MVEGNKDTKEEDPRMILFLSCWSSFIFIGYECERSMEFQVTAIT